MNNLLSQKWCLRLNVQNRIKLCHAKNHKFGDDTTVYLKTIMKLKLAAVRLKKGTARSFRLANLARIFINLIVVPAGVDGGAA